MSIPIPICVSGRTPSAYATLVRHLVPEDEIANRSLCAVGYEAADCSVWVALKGATRNVPAGADDTDFTEMYDAMTVLDPTLPRNHSDGHAVWHVPPARYNASSFPALGGTLHAALPTPVMSAVDGQGYSFHAQAGHAHTRAACTCT